MTVSLLCLLGIGLGLMVNVRILVAVLLVLTVALPLDAIAGESIASIVTASAAGLAVVQIGYFVGLVAQTLGSQGIRKGADWPASGLASGQRQQARIAPYPADGAPSRSNA